jgi:ATP-dependent helicase HrpB
VGDVVAHLRRHRAVVVTAAPGAGKTTRVPPALTPDGPVLLLQPRRVAARAIARRIADEQGWTIGREVGWHVRFERQFADETRLLVATEGILTARLQQDPLLSGFRTIVLDEFHERSIHADLGIAFARQAWLAREDLRLVVMSATIDAGQVSRFLDDCPVMEVPGRLHAVEVTYRPGVEMDRAVQDALGGTRGALLCFLPGAPEIRRTAERLASVVPTSVPVLPLHGGLDADEQDRAIASSEGPRVILATNIAETTLTVPDVTTVIDSGLHKVARYDAERAIDRLETERISRDSAEQRAGRAGRVAAGTAVRLWDTRDRLQAHREPEIVRVDLAPVLLDVIAWGADPRAFGWFDAPPADAVDAGLALLRALGALDDRARLTSLGDDLRRLPLHPRLARVLLDAGGDAAAALACAVLSERHFVPSSGRATTSDVLSAIDDDGRLPWHVKEVARDLKHRASAIFEDTRCSETDLLRALLAGYPDRVARRRAPSSDRFLMASGSGARLGRESGVYEPEFVVALDVMRTTTDDPIIRLASGIEREWLQPDRVDLVHEFDAGAETVRAVQRQCYGAIVLAERSVPVDPDIAANLLADVYLARERSDVDRQLLARLAVAGMDAAACFTDAVRAASRGATSLGHLNLIAALPYDVRHALDRDAPIDLPLPSGRTTRLEYHADGRVLAAAKLQELFGLGETPRVGTKRLPVTFELLAPNGRPVQVTSDLKSFWTSGYQEVRKELRARYPRHPWPEDPWTAQPTHRPLRRRP